VVEVLVDGQRIGEGEGRSRREAETMAAEGALESLESRDALDATRMTDALGVPDVEGRAAPDERDDAAPRRRAAAHAVGGAP
jgi:hypothetical protein